MVVYHNTHNMATTSKHTQKQFVRSWVSLYILTVLIQFVKLDRHSLFFHFIVVVSLFFISVMILDALAHLWL